MTFDLKHFCFALLTLLVINNSMKSQTAVRSYLPIHSSLYDSLFSANDWRLEIDEKAKAMFGKDWKNKMLKVGDSLKLSYIGLDVKDTLNQINLNKINKKLIIFDFWNTYCRTCIEGFPKLENLQRNFSDNIQIILINVFETKEQIFKRFPKNKKIPNLIMAFNSQHLFPYFPTSSMPYHIWIDSSGVIKLLGSSFNTYEKKISEFLEGRSIDFVETESTKPAFNPAMPYHKLINNTIRYKQYNSYFTPFDYNYATIVPGHVSNLIDSNNSTRRNTFVNYTLYDLILYAWKDVVNDSNRNIIYSPVDYNIFLNRIDTVNYTNRYTKWEDFTDDSYVRNRYCYEQLVPLSMEVSEVTSRMQQDISELLRSKIKNKITIIDTIVSAKVVVRSNNKLDDKDVLKLVELYQEEHAYYEFQKFQNQTLKYAISNSITGNRKSATNRMYIIDEVEKKESEVVLPQVSSFEELKEALRIQGFTIIEKQKRIKAILIDKM